MHGKGGVTLQTGNELASNLRDRLKKAIAADGQLVCINEIKKHNIKRGDRWVKVQKYLAAVGGRKLYGAANWNVYDFIEGCRILPRIFSGKVLVVGGHASKLRDAMAITIDSIDTPARALSNQYDKYFTKIARVASKYDNILFCCGPCGKVILSELVSECDSNLIDIGALANAIIAGATSVDLTKSWNMSWTRTVDLKKCASKLVRMIK
jgi:hypothetical protein